LKSEYNILEKEVKDLKDKLNNIDGKKPKAADENSKLDETKQTTKKPTDEDVYSVIENSLRKSVPVIWSRNLLGGSNVNVSSLEN